MIGFAPLLMFITFTWAGVILGYLAVRHLLNRNKNVLVFKKSVQASYWGTYRGGNAALDKEIDLPKTFAAERGLAGSSQYARGGG